MEPPILKDTDELPDSGEQFKAQKGTVAAWFFNILVCALVALSGVVVYLFIGINNAQNKGYDLAKIEFDKQRDIAEAQCNEIKKFYSGKYNEEHSKNVELTAFIDSLKDESFRLRLGKMLLEKDRNNTIILTKKIKK